MMTGQQTFFHLEKEVEAKLYIPLAAVRHLTGHVTFSTIR